ncbi:hypothetical protein D3C72_781910 [compost metagenome]
MRRVAAERQYVAVSGFQLAVDPHTVDAITGVVEFLNVLAKAEFDTEFHGHFGEARGEDLAVAGLVIRQAQGTGEDVSDTRQGRLYAGNAGAVEDFKRHAGFFQHGDVFAGVIQLCLGAEQLSRTEAAAFVGDAGFGAQFIEAVAAVLGQTHHALLVHRVTAGGAVAQHLRHPQVLVDVGGGFYRERGVALQQPLDRLQRHARRGPRRGVARRDLAGVGETGLHGRGWLSVDHHHFKPGTGQIVSTGGTDDAATQDHYAHFCIPHRGGAAYVCC